MTEPNDEDLLRLPGPFGPPEHDADEQRTIDEHPETSIDPDAEDTDTSNDQHVHPADTPSGIAEE